ncbi:MAG: FG-GAP-like repeat-containing protein, partial [Bacteroidota bacterium]
LDNDGDLDVVTNNIDAPAFLYENKTAKGDHWIAFNLKGPKGHLQGIGTKAIVYKQDKKMVVEHFPVKGFQSSSLGLLHIGIGDPSTVDSVLLIWPDQRYQKWTGSLQGLVEATYKVELPLFDYQQLKPKPAPVAFDDITEKSGLSYTHQENPFVEFNREPLIPHSTSSEGPALAVGDLNGDGLDDIFLGGSKRKRSALYWQKSNGTFVRQRQNAIDLDSIYEDVDAIILDFNGDGKNDLMVASGGNEYYNESEYLLSRLYLNDGKGNLEKKADAFTGIYATAACLAVKDINGDGHPDVFMGTRAEPWSYGTIPQSYLLINDGTGRFKDASNQYADDLADVGLVTDAKWIDMDGDQKEDLVVATEWGKISAFLHKGSRLERLDLTKKKGLWNTIEAIDFDKDGDMDLIAGNLGKNARLQPKADAPVKMYIHDFDANKKVETILTYHLGGREVIFPNKMELEKQIPPIKKKFLFASDFAKATVEEVMGTDNHTAAQRLNIDYTANSLIVNLGDGTFETRPLPWEAQLSPYKATQVVDINKDGYDDVLVGGNYYDANVQMGRYDADYGTVLLNQAGKGFEVIRAHNLIVKGQVRNIALIRSKGKEVYLLAKNNDAAQLVTIN